MNQPSEWSIVLKMNKFSNQFSSMDWNLSREITLDVQILKVAIKSKLLIMMVNCRNSCKKYSQWDDLIPNPIKLEMVLQGSLQ